MQLKIATFNMKHDHLTFLKTHWNHRRKAIFSFFVEHDLDIIGTQELTYERILEVSDMLPDYHWVGIGREGGKKGEFCAIFYKKDLFTCLQSDTFWLSESPDIPNTRGWFSVFPRICTWALLQTKGGKAVAIFNTHLDHVSVSSRVNGLNLIGAYIAEKRHLKNYIMDVGENVPAILMGDFNSQPNGQAVKHLDLLNSKNNLFENSSYKVFMSKTYHGFKGATVGNPIDYIFTSKNITIDDVYPYTKKSEGVYPSDHYPIIMNITL